MRFRLALSACFLALATLPAGAQAPSTIGHQGVLTTSGGAPVADGTYSLTFRLYSASSGGTALWTETHSSVSVSSGVFSAALGSLTLLNISFEQPLWLSVSVNSGAELSPRVQLTAAPYSMTAKSVADNAITSSEVADGTIATADLADGSVTSAKISDGTIAAADIATSTLTAGKIAAGQVVKSLNSLTDAVTLAAGSNVTITPSGNTLTIAASGGSGSTLDQAYDQGGAGAGRTITADAGAVDIQGAGGLTVAGNVGIGTSSPGRLLDLTNSGSAGTVYPLRLINNTTANTGTGVGIEFGFQAGTQILSAIESVHQGSSQTDLILKTQNTSLGEAMRIKGDGKVGIGTTTPAAKLEVAGDVLVGGSTASGKAVYAASGDHLTLISSNTGGAGIRLQAGAPGSATEHMRIDGATGKVGIGTTAPGAKLSVTQSGATNADGIRIVNGATTWNEYSDAAGKLLIESSGGAQVAVQDNGLVGIGTATPSEKLSIDGGHINLNHATVPYMRFQRAGTEHGYVGSAGALFVGTQTDFGVRAENNLVFGNSSVERMRINSAGNVGIGTSSPGERLDVEASNATVAAFNRTTGDGTIISIQQSGTEQGTISVSAGTVSYNAFTGSHLAWTEGPIDHGMLVSLTGINRRRQENPMTEIVYGIIPTSAANDPRVLGAYLGPQESSRPPGVNNPHLVAAVGNGEMWIMDNGTDVMIGDYLISSGIAGHAMVDRGQYEIAHIVARAAEPVHWDDVRAQAAGRKHKNISVFFESFVRNHKAERLERRIAELERSVARLESMVAAPQGPERMLMLVEE